MVIYKKLSATRLIALTFLAIILIGSFILTTPFVSRDGTATGYVDALFTSVSAVCVTGLVPFDTWAHWNTGGQVVIMLLIQTGGLGIMSIFGMVSLLLRKKLSNPERRVVMQSAGMLSMDGLPDLLRLIFGGTAIVEGIGALLLALDFCPQMGLGKGLFYAVFHSVSAFCNAGFDLMGYKGESLSLSTYVNDAYVCLIITGLIIVGGLGYTVWDDVRTKKLKFSSYKLHSKIVLTATAILLVGGTLLFFGLENSSSMEGMSGPHRLLASWFMSTSARTAGFNTVDLTALSHSAMLVMIVLMFIGGSPGSTAGGVKTTTFMLQILNIMTLSKKGRKVNVFKRQIDSELLAQASAIVAVYIIAIVLASGIICAIQPYDIGDVLFEVASACGTVGLSVGISATGCAATKLVLIAMMFMGRIGGLTLLMVFAERRPEAPVERPCERILIG